MYKYLELFFSVNIDQFDMKLTNLSQEGPNFTKNAFFWKKLFSGGHVIKNDQKHGKNLV